MKNIINTLNIHPNKIHNYVYENDGQHYKVLYYDEEMLCNNDIEAGRYRSVVVSIPEHKILAFAPPKTIPFSLFKQQNPLLNDIVVHEYIDGIMVQVFYDNKTSSWKLNSVLIKNMLFDSKLDAKAFIIATQGNIEEPFNKLEIFDYFPKNYSYTFIIKKQNTFQSCMYLISVYKLCDSNEVIYIPQCEYENWPVFTNLTGIICFPKPSMINGSYKEFVDDLYYDNNPSKWVITNIKTGMQTTISTNEYKLQQQLYTINKQLFFQYFCLHRIYKNDEYIKRFSKNKKEFYRIKQTYDWFIRTVHEIYINYFIVKSLDKLPIKYKPFVTQIHQDYYIYSKNHKQSKLVTKQVIQEYFDKKNPWNLLTIIYQES